MLNCTDALIVLLKRKESMDNVINLSEFRKFSSNNDDEQNTDLPSKQIKKLENLRDD